MAYLTDHQRALRDIAIRAKQVCGLMPRNPILALQLHNTCGGVRSVTNPGEAAVIRWRTYDTPVTGPDGRRSIVQRPTPWFERYGESYIVNCPHCGDDRHRLSVSHVYLTDMDQPDGHGGMRTVPMIFGAKCFNDDCMADREGREELESMLTARGALDLGKVPVLPTTAEAELTDPLTTPIQFAGRTTRVDRLPADHPACEYLTAHRGLDPAVLGSRYGMAVVDWCRDHEAIVGSLIIPIYHRGVMVGWQARRVDLTARDAARKSPKYFTMPKMQKSRILFGFDRAVRYRTVTVCEGVFDVVGGADGQGVATLGSSISTAQLDLLREGWGDAGTVIWCPDPDIYAKAATDAASANRFVEQVRQLRDAFAGRFVLLRLPDGLDCGDLHPDVWRETVASAAAAQGVTTIDWGRR